MLNFLTPVGTFDFLQIFKGPGNKPDSERSIGDISETEGDTELRLAPFSFSRPVT